MAMTLAALQYDVLSRLNESGDTPIGQFKTVAGGGSVTITTLVQITSYLNEAADDLARTCFPIPGTGTFSLVSPNANAQLQSFTTGDTSVLWTARTVKWNTTALTYFERSALEAWFPTSATDATGTPAYWYRTGAHGIGVYPAPSATQTLTVTGYVTPPPMLDASPTGVPTWLNPDLEKLLVFYACGMMALKQFTAADLQERGAVWAQQYTNGKAALLARLQEQDPQIAREHFAAPAGK